MDPSSSWFGIYKMTDFSCKGKQLEMNSEENHQISFLLYDAEKAASIFNSLKEKNK